MENNSLYVIYYVWQIFPGNLSFLLILLTVSNLSLFSSRHLGFQSNLENLLLCPGDRMFTPILSQYVYGLIFYIQIQSFGIFLVYGVWYMVQCYVFPDGYLVAQPHLLKCPSLLQGFATFITYQSSISTWVDFLTCSLIPLVYLSSHGPAPQCFLSLFSACSFNSKDTF